LLTALSSGVLVALAVAALGGWIVGRKALRPLTDMARQATSITERNLSERLEAPHEDDELGRLAAAFNALLDRLSAALHAQRQFMADASHQLRTPVSVVRTTAQVMLRRTGRSEREYFESMTIVEEQAARLARLVDAMFLLSRADAGGRTLRPEVLYFDELVAECARGLAVVAAERNVEVFAGGATDLSFTGDDELLRQMVMNLLDNAIRHTRTGGRVSADLQRTADSIVLRVTDEGPGIPLADRQRIFERFVRLEHKSDGAGLGLPMARWIAEAHSGHLLLESTNAGGSCFRVTLPAGHGEPSGARTDDSPPDLIAGVTTSTRKSV
jgi:signal transduction histidine kinase